MVKPDPGAARGGSVLRIDPRTNRVTGRIAIPDPNALWDVAVAGRAVWVADVLGEEVTAASVPGGDFSPAVAEAAAAAGYTELFTSEPVLASRDAYGLTMHGRFIIRRWTTPATAAALAAGDWLACARQRFLWNAKKIGKHLGGRPIEGRRQSRCRRPLAFQKGNRQPRVRLTRRRPTDAHRFGGPWIAAGRSGTVPCPVRSRGTPSRRAFGQRRTRC